MAYKHGIYTSEVATSLVPMTQTDSGLIVAFGTAPVHLATPTRRLWRLLVTLMIGINTPFAN